MKYLIVVAHPDDEVLGAGGTIHKLINDGNEVAIVIMCGKVSARQNPSPTLLADEAKAMGILGVQNVYHADFPNIKMNVVPHLELVQYIERCIVDWDAEAIYTHHPSDVNNDHIITSYAAQAASHLFQRKEKVPQLKEFVYMEVPSSTEWSFDSSVNRFTPNMFVEIGEEGIAIKIQALKAYKGVMRPYPHPRSDKALAGLATYRGTQAGCEYAEAFECVYRMN